MQAVALTPRPWPAAPSGPHLHQASGAPRHTEQPRAVPSASGHPGRLPCVLSRPAGRSSHQRPPPSPPQPGPVTCPPGPRQTPRLPAPGHGAVGLPRLPVEAPGGLGGDIWPSLSPPLQRTSPRPGWAALMSSLLPRSSGSPRTLAPYELSCLCLADPRGSPDHPGKLPPPQEAQADRRAGKSDLASRPLPRPRPRETWELAQLVDVPGRRDKGCNPGTFSHHGASPALGPAGLHHPRDGHGLQGRCSGRACLLCRRHPRQGSAGALLRTGPAARAERVLSTARRLCALTRCLSSLACHLKDGSGPPPREGPLRLPWPWPCRPAVGLTAPAR